MNFIFRKVTYVIYFITVLTIASNFTQSVYCQSIQTHSFSDCLMAQARSYIHTPYKAGTLEVSGDERLVCTSENFDCVTYVEYMLSLCLYQYQTSKNTKAFETILTELRYRNGRINGYGSRLHYFSEWILQQEKNGLIKNITSEIPSSRHYDKKINFMTVHKEKYPKLKVGKNLNKILAAEAAINQHKWSYIPKSGVPKIYASIKDGDIIAITTDKKGLDIVHTGFAIKKGNEVYLLHASETEKKVVVSEKSLHHYLMGNDKQSGIMVLRSTQSSF